MVIKEVTNLNDGVIYFKDDKIFEGDIATKECFDAIYKAASNNPDIYECIWNYVEDYAPDIISDYQKSGGDAYVAHFEDVIDVFHEILANDFVNNEYDTESGFNTFGDSIKGGLEWFIADEEVYENCKTIKENDYSETDEFTLIKEMNHWIKQLKNFFVDDKKAQKAIADYFYYDDGKHQEDFKELQSSVKTLHKLWLKLDNIVEEVEEKEYNKSKNESVTIKEQSANIEVENPGILEVPEGKNVEDLPIKHFVALADKKGLSTITRALNNLQVWNKNKNPKLSKWAGDMIDKVTKRFENQKKESISRLHVKEEYDSDEALLKKFIDTYKDELTSIAYKNGYRLDYEPYYTLVPDVDDYESYNTAICLDLYEINHNEGDIVNLDNDLAMYISYDIGIPFSAHIRHRVEGIPGGISGSKRICIYYLSSRPVRL